MYRTRKAQRILPKISAVLALLAVCSCGATRADRPQEKTNESAPTLTRVFSRWTVKPTREDDFVSSWSATTRQNMTAAKDFRGALLLRNQNDRSQFLAIEHWASNASWNAFRTSSSASPLQSMVSSHSSEAFNQIYDRLDTSEWKRKLIRIYGLRVDERNRSAFIDTWLKVNMAIGEKMTSARGGLLLSHPRDRSMFYEVVRWDSFDAWKKFIAAPAADEEAFQKIFSMMSLVSTESFDEIDSCP